MKHLSLIILLAHSFATLANATPNERLNAKEIASFQVYAGGCEYVKVGDPRVASHRTWDGDGSFIRNIRFKFILKNGETFEKSTSSISSSAEEYSKTCFSEEYALEVARTWDIEGTYNPNSTPVTIKLVQSLMENGGELEFVPSRFQDVENGQKLVSIVKHEPYPYVYPPKAF